MLQSLKAGGFFMIPIIVCGIIATFIIIERCIYFFNTKKRDDALMSDLNNSFDTIVPKTHTYHIFSEIYINSLFPRDRLSRI